MPSPASFASATSGGRYDVIVVRDEPVRYFHLVRCASKSGDSIASLLSNSTDELYVGSESWSRIWRDGAVSIDAATEGDSAMACAASRLHDASRPSAQSYIAKWHRGLSWSQVLGVGYKEEQIVGPGDNQREIQERKHHLF